MNSSETLTSERPSNPTSDVKWRSFWIMLLAVALPMMIPYLSELWGKERYRFAIFALLVVIGLTYSRWDRQFHAPRGWISWVLIGFGFLTIALGCLLFSPWTAAVGFVAFATVFLASSRGEHDLSLIGLSLPLLLLIRLPLGYDQMLVLRLQQITTSLTSVLLDVVAIPHAVANNVLQLATRELFVAEACSGIQSVFTLLFLTTLLFTVNRRPLWLFPLYLLIGIVLAISANVLRVTTVAIGDVWFAVDLAEGWQHELVGYLALIAAALFLLSFDRLIIALLHPVDPPLRDGDRNLLAEFWNFLVGHRDEDGTPLGPIVSLVAKTGGKGAELWQAAWSRRGLIAVSAVLAVASLGQAINLQRPIEIIGNESDVIYQPPADIFDNLEFELVRLGEHEQAHEGSNPRLGENADIWYLDIDRGNTEGEFVLSQPFRGWHELCLCYARDGWVLLNRVVRHGGTELTQDAEPGEAFALARFRTGDDYAYLFYSAIDSQGNVLKPLPTPGRLSSRFLDYFYESEQLSRIMMVQMLLTGSQKLSREDVQSLATDFVQMRDRLQRGAQQEQTPDCGDTGVQENLASLRLPAAEE